MQILHALLLASALLGAAQTFGGSTIQARLFSLSIALDPATTSQNGDEFDLQVTGRDSSQPANSELAALAEEDGGYSNGGLLLLYEPLFFDGPIPMQFALDVPAYVDSDGDGVHDFFESAAAVNESSTGAYIDPTDGKQHPLNAKWTRLAGSATGICQLQLSDLGLTFNPVFHLLEYTGSLTYSRAGTNISSQISLAQTGVDQSNLTGPLALQVADTNALSIVAGQLNRSADVTVQSSPSYIDLTATTHLGDIVVDLDGTVYSGIILLSDGEPATAAADYQAWVLALRDTGDANTNGIPDLTDNTQAVSPSAPTLLLSRDNDSLKLSIAGTIGATYELEQSMNLAVLNWETNRSITLGTSPQMVDLGENTNAVTFFRARAQ